MSILAAARCISLAATPLLVACGNAPEPAKVSKALDSILADDPPTYLAEREAIGGALQRFYADNDHTAVWFDGAEPVDAADALLRKLRAADSHGLVPADYAPDELAETMQSIAEGAPSARALARADIQLSFAFMDYAGDLHAGRIDPEAVDPKWYTSLQHVDYAPRLRAALDGSVAEVLTALVPPHAGYDRLRDGLADYRGYVETGGWPRIAEGEILETGDSGPRVITLRKRLAVTGELDGLAEPPSKDYDEALAEAVRRFQTRHGLKVDGKLGPGTRTALNVPAEARVRQIEMNLERWRWLPQDLGEQRYIVVNIPEFRLRAYTDDAQVMTMPVIVGEEYDDRDTPIFVDRMQFLVFRPYWNIPHSIAAEEILPKAREQENYLVEKNYQIVPTYAPDAEPKPVNEDNLAKVAAGEWRLRETAGSGNALGLVKFLFPNSYAVYLHDTPADHLFSKTERDFSHGCIRVRDPAELADWVLANQDSWDLARVQKAMHGDQRRRVELNQPIPVYLLYWTAFALDSGPVQFREDLYGHDAKLDEALQEAG